MKQIVVLHTSLFVLLINQIMKNFFLFFLLFTYYQTQAQLNVAIGATSHHGVLDYQINGQFKNSPYFNAFTHSYGSNLLISINSQQRFSYRISLNHHQKDIRTGKEFLQWYGTVEKSYDRQIIPSYEIGFAVNYQIDATSIFLTRLGFVVSANEINGNGAISGHHHIIVSSPKPNDWFYNGAIQAGSSYLPKWQLLNRQLEFSVDFFFSPRMFLPEPIVTEDLIIQGRYHYASSGLYLWLFKQKTK